MMPVYMVERVLPGATLESVEVLRAAADGACRVLAQSGKPVRYLRSTFTPGESRCRCLFEAPNADRVRELNEAAQLPYTRIILALDLESSSEASVGSQGSPGEKDCRRIEVR